jgi:hypothetical protein
MRLVLSALVLPALLTFGASRATADDPYAGRWVVNVEETQAVAVPFEKGGGLGGSKWRPNITVMGVPLPGTQKMPPMSNLRAKDPMVLRAAAMIITAEQDRMRVEYPGVGKETLRKGHYRGRDTKFSKKGIRQKYKTPERRVTKVWSIRPDGRLLVEVQIKPVRDKVRTHRRVFERPNANAADPTKEADGPIEPAGDRPTDA